VKWSVTLKDKQLRTETDGKFNDVTTADENK
jgi:hypothetical protein